jgi:hypothetical protein
MNTSLVPGSLGAIAQQSGKSVAEIFLSAEAIILVDTSGSMDQRDSRGGQKRYDLACQELTKLQAAMPGKCAVIAFSGRAVFCPGGIPEFLGGGTNLAEALRFIHHGDTPDMRFVIISDGEPDSEPEAEREAAKFVNQIDCVYVGPEGGAGQTWLYKLARLHQGQGKTAAQAQELATTVETLLLTN